MRLIKPVLIGFTGLSLVLIAISSLMPGEVMTSKWVMVHGETAPVLAEIRDLRKWPEWNGLLSGVNDFSVDIKPAQTDTGSTISWTDQRGGKNSLIVTENNEKGIVTTLYMGKDQSLESGFSVEKRQADSVQVIWFIIEKLKWYPWEKFYGMMAADMKGPLMQQSLDKLKTRLEGE
jgi:hypothetical protein